LAKNNYLNWLLVVQMWSVSKILISNEKNHCILTRNLHCVISAIDIIKNDITFNEHNTQDFANFIDHFEKNVINNRVLLLKQTRITDYFSQSQW
jgi:hypothetical protein